MSFNTTANKTNIIIMISPEEIQEFLEGADPEEHIVSVEYDYASDAVYKIKEIPLQGKRIIKDSLYPIRMGW